MLRENRLILRHELLIAAGIAHGVSQPEILTARYKRFDEVHVFNERKNLGT